MSSWHLNEGTHQVRLIGWSFYPFLWVSNPRNLNLFIFRSFKHYLMRRFYLRHRIIETWHCLSTGGKTGFSKTHLLRIRKNTKKDAKAMSMFTARQFFSCASFIKTRFFSLVNILNFFPSLRYEDDIFLSLKCMINRLHTLMFKNVQSSAKINMKKKTLKIISFTIATHSLTILLNKRIEWEQ